MRQGMNEGSKKGVMVNVRLSEQMDDWLDDKCEMKGMNKSEFIRYLIMKEMDTEKMAVDVLKGWANSPDTIKALNSVANGSTAAAK